MSGVRDAQACALRMNELRRQRATRAGKGDWECEFFSYDGHLSSMYIGVWRAIHRAREVAMTWCDTSAH